MKYEIKQTAMPEDERIKGIYAALATGYLKIRIFARRKTAEMIRNPVSTVLPNFLKSFESGFQLISVKGFIIATS
jgi:hypothetical protein